MYPLPNVSFLVPFDTEEPWRIRDWTYIRNYLHSNYRGWQVCVGTCRGGDWCRPEAIIDAYSQATGDILVIQEPDSMSLGLPAAIQAVADKQVRWSVGHMHKHRLTELSTGLVLGGWKGDASSLPTVEPPYVLVPGNTGLVMHRRLFEDVPPDPLFMGWGGEDQAWGLALRELAGVEWRSGAPLVHLYHDNEGRDAKGQWHTSPETKHRFMKYELAVNHPDKMRDLVCQARDLMATI